jgi:hypothetical protein
MNLRKLALLAVLSLAPLVPARAVAQTAPPAIDAKDAVRAEQWIAGHKAKLARVEAYLAETSPEKILGAQQLPSLNDLRRDMRKPHPNIDFRAHAEYPALEARLLAARTGLARRGLYVGEWREWSFDGKQVGPEEEKFLLSFEDKFASLRGAIGVSTRDDETIAKMQAILARPEFTSNPVLASYKENLGKHLLDGVIYRTALLRVGATGNALRSLKNDVDKNGSNCRGECTKRVHEEAQKIVTMVDQIKAAGLDPKKFKIMLDEREPLSETWDLEAVRAWGVKTSKK